MKYYISNWGGIHDTIQLMRELRNPFFILILVLSLLTGTATLTRGHEWGDDFASYIMQAKSILNGDPKEFVERNAFTIFESSFQIGPVAYPWGYPLILTPALAIKGVHPLTLKLPGLVFFAGFLICLYLLTKDRLAQTESLLLVSLFAFNPTLIKFLDQILSDIPLLFFMTLGLLLLVSFKTDGPWWRQVVLGVVLFSAFFVRTTGILLFASFLVHQFISFLRDTKTRKTLLVNSVVTTLTLILLWFGNSVIFPNGQGSYFEQLKGLTPAIFGQNTLNYFSLFAQFFGPGPSWTFIYYALVVFFLIGAWTRRVADTLLIIFFALYFIAMLFWPAWQGIRFIFPLLPIFIYFAFRGIGFAVQKLPAGSQSLGTGLAYSLWLAIIGIFLFTSGTRAYTNVRGGRQINGPFDPVSSDMYNYIRAETPPDSVVVFWKPRAMRLFTGRDTFMSTECDRLALGDFVVISKKAENSQIPPNKINQCNLVLSPVFENQRFIIYEVPQ